MSGAGQHELNPDWTVAPAALLSEWLEENRVSPRVLAAWCGGLNRQAESVALIQEVLDRKPVTDAHARLLARGTHIPASFWLRFEQRYRADLAAGRTDAEATPP